MRTMVEFEADWEILKKIHLFSGVFPNIGVHNAFETFQALGNLLSIPSGRSIKISCSSLKI